MPRVFAENPLRRDVYHPQVLVGSERSIRDKSNSLHGTRIWLGIGVDFSFFPRLFFILNPNAIEMYTRILRIFLSNHRSVDKFSTDCSLTKMSVPTIVFEL